MVKTRAMVDDGLSCRGCREVIERVVRGGTYHGAEFICGSAQQGDRVEIPNGGEESKSPMSI